MERLSDSDYSADLQARKALAAYDFSRNSNGFKASVEAGHGTWVYFTVPYDRGWTAQVNGQAVEITKVNGFMAVPVAEGDHEIVFSYNTPGLKLGIIATSGSCLLLIAGGVYGIRKQGKKRR